MKALRLDLGLVWKLVKQTASDWWDDNALRLSAALSYYSIFSIAPLLIIAIGIVGAVFGAEAAQGKIAAQLSQFVGWEAAQALQAMVKSASETGGGATVVGFLTLLVGASSVFGQLKDSLNTIWGVRAKSGRGIKGFLKERLLTFGMVLVIGFLLLISLVLTTAMAALNGWLEAYLQLPKAASAAIGFFLPLSVEIVLFTLLYKLLPDVKIAWRSVWLGALVTALLFELGKTGLAFYLSKSSPASSFGAAGSVVVLLVWIYYASCILFFGAEFTKVYAEESGHRIVPADYAEVATGKECSVKGTVQPVGVQPNPLTPHAPVPHVPMKESLAPLLVTPHLEHDVLRETRLSRVRRPVPPTQLQEWIQAAHRHPAAEFGAAIGFGLLLGALTRVFDRKAPALSAVDHFRAGTEKTTVAGKSLAVAAVAWAARSLARVSLDRLRR